MMRARLAGLVLALPLLAACGAGTDATDRTAVDAPAAPVAFRAADGDELVDRLRTAVEGITTTRFDVRLTGELEARASGVADLTTDPPSVRVTPERPLFGLAEARLVKGDLFVKYEGRWRRTDLQPLLGMLPVDLASLDLEALADGLAASLSDVEVSGDTGEEVWRATVDPADLLSELAGTGAVVVEDADEVHLTATFQGDRLDALVVDLGDDLGAVEVTLSDQGEPVEVTAPPARLVEDGFGFGWSSSTPHQPDD